MKRRSKTFLSDLVASAIIVCALIGISILAAGSKVESAIVRHYKE